LRLQKLQCSNQWRSPDLAEALAEARAAETEVISSRDHYRLKFLPPRVSFTTEQSALH
jgi:hypothetical protein